MDCSKICNINAGVSFVDVLARLYLKKYQNNPQALADVLFLLPNRRACQNLIEAFVRENGLKPTILPQIKPIAEADEDEVTLTSDLAVWEDLPPAVDNTEKILQFTKLILKKSDLNLDKISLAQAYALAQNLAALMDLVQNEQLSFDNIEKLVSEEYAVHWQQTVALLRIITQYWPQILKEQGKTDQTERRNLLLQAEIEDWVQTKTEKEIVVAGTTAAFPILKKLIKTVLTLPRGAVYLYGLDYYLTDADWEKIDENHPQYELKELLEYLHIGRNDVENVGEETFSSREKITAEVMRPAETSVAWRDLTANPMPQNAFENIKLLNCDDIRQEAEAIALIIRNTLEESGKTAALVTMDRNLSRRVVSELQRWNIAADDSAGKPLSLSPIGTYLRLVWNVVEDATQTAIIALMKHPFTACGFSRAKFNEQARRLEYCWRKNEKSDAETELFLQKFYDCLQPLSEIYAQPRADFAQILQTHIIVAERLANTDSKRGEQIIWREDAGTVAAKWIADFMDKCASLGTIAVNDYGAFITTLLAEQTVRPRYGTHPRVKILGPIEARLTQYDVTIIGEANEGSWPQAPQADMWMSRPMKKDFGLPLPERQIGVAAADFAHLLNAPKVYITRAKKIDGTPINKSRWWLRLETVLEANFGSEDGAFDFIYDQPYAYWAKNLDRRGEYKPIAAPRPCPKIERRPREMWATAIEKWLRDPYLIYAKYVLSLYAMDDLDKPEQPYDFGNIVHEVLEEFNTQYPTDQYPSEQEARAILRQCGRNKFAEKQVPEETLAFWWPQYEHIVEWIIKKEILYRPEIKHIYNEAVGEMTLPGVFGDFRVKAKADRIDVLKTGGLNIIDYKTGSDKSTKAIKAGKAPQLPIEGMIAQNGGFPKLANNGTPQKVEGLQYWAFKDKFNATDTEDSQRAIEIVENTVKDLIRAYDNPKQPYLVKPQPSSLRDYSDYDHLSRLKEWSSHAAANDDGE